MASLSKENYNPEEYLLKTLMDLDIGFVKVSNDGTILNHNLAFNKIFGFNPEKDLNGTKILDYWLNSEERNKFREILYKDGIVKKYVASAKKVDGEKSFLQLNIKLNKNSKGEIISSEGTFVDVTKRIRTEQELKESEERFRKIIENAPFGYYRVGKDGLWQYVNPVWEKMHDYSLQEVVGKSFEITQPENAKEQARSYVQRVLSGESMAGEFGRTKKGGTVEYHAFNIQPIYQEGEIIAIEGFINDITELKEAQQRLIVSESNLRKLNNELEQIIDERTKELKESEGILRSTLDSAADGILVVDEKGQVKHINSRFTDMWHIPKDLITERDDQKLLDYVLNQLKDPKAFLSKVDQLYRSASEDFDTLYFTDGRIFERFSSPLVLEAEIKGRVWSFRDITKRKESEEALKESERRLKEAQALGKIGYWEFDITNQHITWSDQVFEIYNRDPSLGPPSVEEEANYYTPNTNERLKEYARRAIEFGEQFDYDFQVSLPSGMVVQLTALMRSIKNKSGQIIKLVGTVQDITERKEREKEIFDLAQFPSEDPYPILRVNRKGVIYINDAGQKLLNVVDSDQIPEIFQESVKNTFESNQISESEVELDNRVYSFTITPIKDADYVNIYGMDITERKHVEENLKEINKVKSEFLRRASHELKTPLISIKGFSDLILALHEDQLDTPIISKLNEINDGCERLQNIINNLLKASRLESPDLKPKLQKEDLSFLIKFCVHELESLAERRKQSIKLNIDSELYANIEKEEIHDVLSNLLTNAIKYTPSMGKIEIKTESKENFVVVSVKDSGIGFTEKQKTKIFQQFGKIERYGQGLDLGIDGTGLGLYISKRIVESHGGQIWMESEGKNKGASFYFTLPTVK